MIAWVALALALLELLFLLALLGLGARFWHQVRPQLEPLLAMFAPPPANSANTDWRNLPPRTTTPPPDPGSTTQPWSSL